MKKKSQSSQLNLLRVFLIVGFGVVEIVILTGMMPLIRTLISKGFELSDAILFLAVLFPLIIFVFLWKVLSRVQAAAEGNPISDKSQKRMLRFAKNTYLIGFIISGGLTFILGADIITFLLAHKDISSNNVLLFLFFTTVFLSTFLKWRRTSNQMKA